MFSISSGLMSSRRDGPLPPVPTARLFADDVMRTPSITTTGSLVSESEDWPRMRTRDPLPVAPPLTTCTPAARPESTLPMLATGSSATFSDRLICAVVFASSTLRCWPVTVVTTAESEKAAEARVTFCVAVAPAATTTVAFRAS
jgi:hypothetical protein